MRQEQRFIHSWLVFWIFIVVTAILLALIGPARSEEKKNVTLQRQKMVVQPGKIELNTVKTQKPLNVTPVKVKPLSPAPRPEPMIVPAIPASREEGSTNQPTAAQPSLTKSEEPQTTRNPRPQKEPGPHVDRCFIATAAYGSLLAPQVKILREFRDKHLLTNKPGRMLVAIYYDYSPPIAAFISDHRNVKALVRMALTVLVYFIQHSYFLTFGLCICLAGLFEIRRHRA